MDNLTLIQTFAENITAKAPTFQYNSELRIEPASGSLQLVTATGGIVAVSQTTNGRSKVAVRHHSAYWTTVHQVMLKTGFLPVGKARMPGFLEYQNIAVPQNYTVKFTDGLDMLQAWWSYKVPGKAQPAMSMLILHRDHWYPVQDLTCEQGTVLIHTLGDILKLYPLDSIVWLQQARSPQPVATASDQPKAEQKPSDTLQTAPEASPPVPPIDSKKIGSYLVDAALLSAAQVELILCDQQATGMRFGEILVKRGWLKEQTIEFLMHNLILPQRAAARRMAASAARQSREHLEPDDQTPPDEPQPFTPNLDIHSRETFVTQDCLDTVDDIPNPSTGNSIHNRETLITGQVSSLIPFERMPRRARKESRQALTPGAEPDDQS